jgi:hypothetical protein
MGSFLRGLLAAALLLVALPPVAYTQSDYLPLDEGHAWELVSGNQHMRLMVKGKSGNEWVVVQWDNPFVNATFRFTKRGQQVLLSGLDMGTGMAHMPADTVYFDFNSREGTSWSNALGTVRVVSRGRNVTTPSGNYSDTIEFELVAKDNAKTYWTFARGVGFVRFGQGRGAFLLAGAPGVKESASSAPAVVSRSTNRNTAATSGKGVLIGIDANPTVPEGYDDNAKRNRVKIAVDSGVTFMYLHPKWNEVEPQAGRYNFNEIDSQVDMARSYNLPLSVNLRIVDTNTRAIPSSYSSWSFRDPQMSEKLRQVLGAMAPHLDGRVRWITIGNEVDNYFGSRTKEIDEYAVLIRNVMPTVRNLFPNAAFSINFTHGAAGDIGGKYGRLADLVEFFSFTYYPLNADFTFRSPSVAGEDIKRIVRVTGDRPVVFQEIGYASSTQLGSSDENQAEFIRNVFQALRDHVDKIVAANFVWMSDLPPSVVDDLGKYYQMGNSANFKAFLATLGYWDQQGRPKKAWQVFAREAPSMRR